MLKKTSDFESPYIFDLHPAVRGKDIDVKLGFASRLPIVSAKLQYGIQGTEQYLAEIKLDTDKLLQITKIEGLESGKTYSLRLSVTDEEGTQGFSNTIKIP